MDMDYLNSEQSESWKFSPPSMKEVEKLKKLVIDSLNLDSKKLDDFLSRIIWSPGYDLFKEQDKGKEQKKLEEHNEIEIQQAIKDIERGTYKSLRFIVKLDAGSREGLNTINITSSRLERELILLLRNLTKDNRQQYNKKGGRKYQEAFNIRCALIITKAFCFLNQNPAGQRSKNDKFYFSGLILALKGGLKSEEEFLNSYKDKDQGLDYKYPDHRSYLLQNTKKHIQKLKPEGKGLYNKKIESFFTSLLIEKISWEHKEDIFKETMIELFGEYPEIEIK